MTLEEELGGLLRAVGLGSRQRRAVARRLGWDGAAPATLAEAGAANGYTRERVRQLEERAIARVAQARPVLPTTEEAVAVVGEAAPAGRAEVARLLANRGLSKRPFDAAGVLSAAALAGIAVDVVAEPGAVLRRDDLVINPVVAQVARRLVARDGATTPAAIAKLTGLSRRRVRRLLELAGDVTWLDAPGGWLTLTPLGGAVGGAIRKFAALEASPDPDDVCRALASLRPPVDLPPGVVAQLLSLVLTDGIESELSATEWLLVDAMRGGGGVARLRHTLDALEEAGLARGTAAVCLGRSPLFRRVERGVWALAVGSAA